MLVGAIIFIAATCHHEVGKMVVIHVRPGCIHIFPHAVFVQGRLLRFCKFPVFALQKDSAFSRLEAPINTSSVPSPLMSPTASAGPSRDTMCGMSGSRSNSINGFSMCLYSSPRFFGNVVHRQGLIGIKTWRAAVIELWQPALISDRAASASYLVANLLFGRYCRSTPAACYLLEGAASQCAAEACMLDKKPCTG